MKIAFILFICVTGSAATCLILLNENERERSRDYPGRFVKWHRRLMKFETIEAFNQNYTSICSVDYVEDITGQTIVISGEVLLPYLGLNPDQSLTGYLGDIWTILESALKFRTKFRSGRYSGGELLKTGEVDEWLAPIAMIFRNSGHTVYSHPIGYNYYGLYTPIFKLAVSKWWYMSVFSHGLWAMSFVSVIGITGLLWSMYRFKTAICQNYEECNNELAIPSFNLLSVLGVITGQGLQQIPNAWSLRITILSAVIMGMLISCGFSSTLTSYLAIRTNTLSFGNLGDIVRAKTHGLCVRNQSTAHLSLLEMEKNDTSHWKNLINKNCQNMDNPVEYQGNLCRKGVVYVEAPDVFLAVYTPIQARCDIEQIPGKHWTSRIAFLHARGARHGPLINKFLLRLRSAGILDYLERKWISKVWPTTPERNLTFQEVKSDHINLITTALVVMMFVSGFICVLENIWFYFHSSNAKKNMMRLRPDHAKCLRQKPSNFSTAPLDATSRWLWTNSMKNTQGD